GLGGGERVRAGGGVPARALPAPPGGPGPGSAAVLRAGREPSEDLPGLHPVPSRGRRTVRRRGREGVPAAPARRRGPPEAGAERHAPRRLPRSRGPAREGGRTPVAPGPSGLRRRG